MKIHISAISILLLSLFSLNAQADDQKHLNIGVGLYGLVVGYDDSAIESDEYSGITISALYASSDNLALRGNFYSIEHDDVSALEGDGIDLIIYLGTGLATQGVKIYAGGGLFSETQEAFGLEKDFSGLQFSGGIGYNLDSIAIDAVIGIRDSSDYEDLVGVNAAAVTVSVILSMRI